MSKEKNIPASGTDSPDVTADCLNDLLLEMFRRKQLALLPDPDDVAPEQLVKSLSSTDRAGLASLGSSEELIRRIVSATGTKPRSDEQRALLTQCESAETFVEQGSAIHGIAATEDFLEMIGDVEHFEKQQHVAFQRRYLKLNELGRGGQGAVYRIEGEDDFSAAFALKVFWPQAYKTAADFTADMTRMQRIASLIHHQPDDNLVDIGWFGRHGGVHMMQMQYIDGFDLRRLLQPQRLQPLKQCVTEKRWIDINNVVYSVNGSQQLALRPAIAVYIVERVLRGLGALHNRDIVHGDIKPSNIMLNASGSVKIIDVGSAFEVKKPPTRHHFTPTYAAPEFLETETMSKQSDLASVGYMLIELLSGKPIVDAVANPDESTKTIAVDSKQELLSAKQTLPDRLANILPPNVLASNHLVELCRCLIDPDLKRRFPSAADSIVDRKGTYEFSKELMLADLGVCNYHEVSQWLANIKQATQWVTGDL